MSDMPFAFLFLLARRAAGPEMGIEGPSAELGHLCDLSHRQRPRPFSTGNRQALLEALRAAAQLSFLRPRRAGPPPGFFGKGEGLQYFARGCLCREYCAGVGAVDSTLPLKGFRGRSHGVKIIPAENTQAGDVDRLSKMRRAHGVIALRQLSPSLNPLTRKPIDVHLAVREIETERRKHFLLPLDRQARDPISHVGSGPAIDRQGSLRRDFFARGHFTLATSRPRIYTPYIDDVKSDPAPRGSGAEKKMANHPNRRGKFELTFEGGAMARYFPRYRRWHPTHESAEQEADRVYSKLNNDCLPTACHRHEIHRAEAA